jgi:hypothetical protein
MLKVLLLALVGILSGCANTVENRINRDLAAAYVSIEKVYALCLQATPLNKISDCGIEYIYNLNRLPPHPQLAVELRYANKLYSLLAVMQKKKVTDWNTYNEMNNKFIAEYNQEIKIALANGNYVSNYPGAYSGSSSSSAGPFTSTAPATAGYNSSNIVAPANALARCVGYSGPGGPCYSGPGGGLYTGPGGGAYTGPGGGAYTGPGGGAYTGPGGGAYTGPGGGAYTGPGGGLYTGPGGGAYTGPGGGAYTGPGGGCYAGPGGKNTDKWNRPNPACK